jgi:hypothetical protein
VATTYEVWLLDPTGNLLDIIDEWLYLRYDRVLSDIGTLELGLDGSYPNPDFIKLDGRIIVWRNGSIETETSWFIRRIIKTMEGDGTLTISIAAFSANEILTRRIVAYDAGTSYADKTGLADDVMKEILAENFGSSASNSARNLSTYFSIESDTSQGASISKQFSWNNIMDVIQDISLTTISAGSATYFDVVAPTFNSLEFRTYRGQRGLDHTAGTGKNQVIFSPERGNVVSCLRTFDYSSEISYVYAGGAGFNQFRYIATASDSGRIGQSPFNRREMFLNATQEGVATAVDNAAQAALRENRAQRAFHCEIVSIPGATEYGVHWRFGDLVTVQFEGETIDCSIDAMAVEVEDGQETIKATLRALETT